ncbi:hypothetical protein O181_075054 [Austropuccinia psidii MF-1]|uniref:Uncharacterized protein n=1 Tax=Austropuccinia psidii MF-1 TaxID=1389203 RepID=A0A9Q3FA97_9BASI|nr:hypothetical protein [Austropuccinia psidii MF-1]
MVLVSDNLRELSEESMAPTEINEINKTYDCFKYVRAIEPPCINCQKKGVPCVESATARSTRCQFCNLGRGNFSQANHKFTDNPRRLWSSIKKGGRVGLKAPVDEPPTSDATSGHSNLTRSRMRGLQQWNNTNSAGPILEDPFPPRQPHWSSPRSSYFGHQKRWKTWKMEKKFGGSRPPSRKEEVNPPSYPQSQPVPSSMK